MHSFLQRKLKNLHGEARVWGSSTPRPPLLIVQPKGGLASAAGSRVHGARVPGARGAGARGRAGPGGGRTEEEQVLAAGGSPGGSRRRGHTPAGSTVTLGDFPKEVAGLRAEGEWTGHAGTSPWVGASLRRGEGGSRAGPGPPGEAVSRRRPPASVPAPGRRGARGRGGSSGPGRASPDGCAPAGCAPAEGDSGVGIRRKGSARRKGWTLEAAERQKRLRGTEGWGLGRRGCGIKSALGCAPGERRCVWAQRGGGSPDTWIL